MTAGRNRHDRDVVRQLQRKRRAADKQQTKIAQKARRKTYRAKNRQLKAQG